MAIQSGIIKLRGTWGGYCYYRMGDRYYVRSRTSLNGKRFWKDKAFEASRQSSQRFGEASRLASMIYRKTDPGIRKYELYRLMEKRARTLLHQGESSDKVLEEIEKATKELL